MRKQVFWFAVCHFVMFALWKNLNRFCSCNVKLIAFLVPITLIYQLEWLVKYLAFSSISEWLDVVWQWQQRAETIHYTWMNLFICLFYVCWSNNSSVFHFLLSALKYEPDGRVILAEFETFYLLNTYAPNNGWKEEENSFQRRRKWDKRIQEFVLQCSGKPLIWCGDLNVRWEFLPSKLVGLGVNI